MRAGAAGIDNDAVTGLAIDSGQVLSLRFATEVLSSGFDFLDLHLDPDPARGGERARISIDGSTPCLVAAGESAGEGGYASLDLLALGGPVQGQTIQFTAYPGDLLQDDRDNDYAFAGVNVSALPLPAGPRLFGTADRTAWWLPTPADEASGQPSVAGSNVPEVPGAAAARQSTLMATRA